MRSNNNNKTILIFSVNYVNAQADLEQKEEDIKNLNNELSKANGKLEKMQLDVEAKKELTKKINQKEQEAKKKRKANQENIVAKSEGGGSAASSSALNLSYDSNLNGVATIDSATAPA